MRATIGAVLTMAAILAATQAHAVDQTVPGAGNAAATALAKRSPLVQSALIRLEQQIEVLTDRKLRSQTQDGLFNPHTCIAHRAGLTETDKQAILSELQTQGLYSPADAAAFPGGAEAGVFPPVLNDGSDCPQLPMPFGAAPGSSFGSHHSYPGGLPVHESFNMSSSLSFEENYKLSFGLPGADGLPRVAPLPPFGSRNVATRSDIAITTDWIIAAPMWHDWAKPIVFQWNADGSEFAEFNFGGAGVTDANGAAGDSRTGGHHIISLAETMARNLPALFIVTQACAHSAPTLGNEFKVVNWLRAAAIIARVDPVARGYLIKDSHGNFRLPPARTTDSVDLIDAGQTNILLEYEIHNLSDADFTFSIPAVTEAQVILSTIAADYGYDPTDTARYNNDFRNPVLTYLSAERVFLRYTNDGLSAVRHDLDMLRAKGVI